jgi:hypothetical protein
MPKNEAERLVSQTEGRLCIRYYRRTDGTILTKNCPVGLRALKRRVSRIASASISAALSFFAGIFAVTGLREQARIPLEQIPVVTQDEITVEEKLPDRNLFMGEYAAPDHTMGKVELGEAGPTEQWLDGQMVITEPRPKLRPKRK